MSESSESQSSSSAAGSTPGSIASRTMSAAARAAETLRAAAMDLPEFEGGDGATGGSARDPIALLGDVDLDVTIELGRTQMYVEDVLRLDAGSVIELDKTAGDPVDIFVNDRPIARGDVIVVDDRYCIRITEVLPVPSGDE